MVGFASLILSHRSGSFWIKDVAGSPTRGRTKSSPSGPYPFPIHLLALKAPVSCVYLEALAFRNNSTLGSGSGFIFPLRTFCNDFSSTAFNGAKKSSKHASTHLSFCFPTQPIHLNHTPPHTTHHTILQHTHLEFVSSVFSSQLNAFFPGFSLPVS